MRACAATRPAASAQERGDEAGNHELLPQPVNEARKNTRHPGPRLPSRAIRVQHRDVLAFKDSVARPERRDRERPDPVGRSREVGTSAADSLSPMATCSTSSFASQTTAEVRPCSSTRWTVASGRAAADATWLGRCARRPRMRQLRPGWGDAPGGRGGGSAAGPGGRGALSISRRWVPPA